MSDIDIVPTTRRSASTTAAQFCGVVVRVFEDDVQVFGVMDRSERRVGHRGHRRTCAIRLQMLQTLLSGSAHVTTFYVDHRRGENTAFL